jgi:hypothetical protein
MSRRKAADQAMSQTPVLASLPDKIPVAPVSTGALLFEAIAKVDAPSDAAAEPRIEPATVMTTDVPAMADVLPEAAPEVTPPALATLEAPEMTPARALGAIETLKLATPMVEPLKIDLPEVETARIETAHIETAPSLDDVRPGAPEAPAAAAANVTAFPSWTRVRRLTPLAASIAIAAAAGAMAGSLATAGLGSLWASTPATQTTDAKPLRDAIARINTDLAALKSTIDNSGKTANSQLTKLSDRFDRMERAQSEPAAKLAKLADAVDRIEHRTPAPQSAAAHDVTGSIAAPTVAAPATQPPAEPAKAAGPVVLDGWKVRSVYNGAALIQSRLGSVVEVEPGDTLPGLGRIETIRRQDGRWVVVTSKGLVVAR